MSSISSFLSQVSELEWLIAVCFVFIPVLILGIWFLISNNILFADWWARNIKMRKWKIIRPGNLDQLDNGKVSLSEPEKELCKYYKKFARATDEYTFKNAYEWLKLSGQKDKNPMNFVLWILLFVLTVGEALGSGMLIAPYISDKMTANLVAPVGIVVALIVSFGLLAITHAAGAESAFAQGTKDNLGASSRSERLEQKKIGPGDDYRIDDGIDTRRRFVNRALEGEFQRPRILLRSIACFLLFAVVVLIFALRFEENQQQYQNSVQELPAASSACGGASGVADSSNPFSNMNTPAGTNVPGFSAGTSSPPSVNCNSATAADNAGKASLLSGEKAADIGAVLLAFFYIVVQFIGFNFSRKHSFFSTGKEAYNITNGFLSYAELERERLHPVYERADNALQILRNHLISGFREYENFPSNMTFRDYVSEGKLGAELSEKYGNGLRYSDTDVRIIRGVEALKEALEYRQNLRKSVQSLKNIEDYPLSLKEYFGYMEALEHNSSFDAAKQKVPTVPESTKQTSIFVQPADVLLQDSQVPVKPDLSAIDKNVLSQYDVLDIEAAEEMLKASSLKERRQILEELSEGDEHKKALIQEIYSKMKAL